MAGHWSNQTRTVDIPDLSLRLANRATILDPASADAALNLGQALVVCGRAAAAVGVLWDFLNSGRGPAVLEHLARRWRRRSPAPHDRRQAAICVSPDSGQALSLYADVRSITGDTKTASRQLARAMRCSPSPSYRLRHAVSIPAVFSSVDEIHAVRRALHTTLSEFEADPPLRDTSDPHADLRATLFRFSYHYQPNRELFSRFADVLTAWCPDLTWTAPHCFKRTESKAGNGKARIRIALATAHFGSHSIGKLFASILKVLPRDRFEVFAITRNQPRTGALKQNVSGADHVLFISDDLSRARLQIAELELDVLLWLDIGMDA